MNLDVLPVFVFADYVFSMKCIHEFLSESVIGSLCSILVYKWRESLSGCSVIPAFQQEDG